MAIKKWIGTTSTSWATAGNWSPSGVPAAADDVVIPETATNHLLTNLDRTGDTAGAGLHLASFKRAYGSTVQVGESGTPLQITTDVLLDEGAAALHYKSDTGSGGTTTERAIIRPVPGTFVYFTGDADYDSMEVFSGIVSVSVTSGVEVTKFYALAELDTAMNVTFGDDTIVQTGYQRGGIVTGSSFPISYTLAFGEFNVLPGITSGNIATLIQLGGICYYAGTVAPTSPTGDPVIYLIDGVFDTKFDTIYGSGIGTIYVGPAGEFRQGSLLTITGSVIELGVHE